MKGAISKEAMMFVVGFILIIVLGLPLWARFFTLVQGLITQIAQVVVTQVLGAI